MTDNKRKINEKTFYLTKPDAETSRKMSRIKSKNTTIEKIISKELRRAKIKYRRPKDMCGNPDFWIYKKKILVFCDGDFWHGYKHLLYPCVS
jgi:DNA mismatch endonuclease (patch repair protein)|tara:strand:- start:21 stop:296 length:276 start_codon:yes stop_codon:yes gene_type:complete